MKLSSLSPPLIRVDQRESCLFCLSFYAIDSAEAPTHPTQKQSLTSALLDICSLLLLSSQDPAPAARSDLRTDQAGGLLVAAPDDTDTDTGSGLIELGSTCRGSCTDRCVRSRPDDVCG
jgi:hypothetical protein